MAPAAQINRLDDLILGHRRRVVTTSVVTALVCAALLVSCARVPAGPYPLNFSLEGRSPRVLKARQEIAIPVTVANTGLVLKNFTAVAGVGHALRGHIDEAGAPLQSGVVTDGTRSSNTDSLGFFTLVNVPDGMVTVTPGLVLA